MICVEVNGKELYIKNKMKNQRKNKKRVICWLNQEELETLTTLLKEKGFCSMGFLLKRLSDRGDIEYG